MRGFFAYAMLAVLGWVITYETVRLSRREKWVRTPVVLSGLAAFTLAVLSTVLCVTKLVS